MGEAHRARDTRLKRDVGLKVLPDSFASDPERMARFQREAEVLAALNHPNIAAIYGVEDRALVMELVVGEKSQKTSVDAYHSTLTRHLQQLVSHVSGVSEMARQDEHAAIPGLLVTVSIS
jgi:serine/threonine protein kinase